MRIVILCLLSFLSVSVLSQGATVPIIGTNAIWRYLDNGSDQGTAFTSIDYDDSSWLSGPSQLGYGEADEATVVSWGPNAGNKYPTTYFRHTFNVSNPSQFSMLNMQLLRDDGIIVYVNEAEVYRSNLPQGSIAYTAYASDASDDGKTFQTAVIDPALLIVGDNVISAEVHQSSPGSSDVTFYLELSGNTGPNNPPTTSITAPANNAAFSAPANITINAAATDGDGLISRVEFFQGSTKLGEDTSAPYAFLWTGVPSGNYALKTVAVDNSGNRGTSGIVNIFVSAPSFPNVASKVPPAGNVNSLTQITVTFSEAVTGVHAEDLLVNGAPAKEVSGSDAVYTFKIAQPREGTVHVGWKGNHGITDFENPPQIFNQDASGNSWQYTFADTVAPLVTEIDPSPNTTLRGLTQLTLRFNEPVSGINASDLRINGNAAQSVSGSGDGPYTFTFAQPANGNASVTWAAGHGIRDLSLAGNSFAGGSWSYTLNTNAIFAGKVLINEIMYHAPSHDPRDEFIELYNAGTAAVNLHGWALTRGVSFTFSNQTLAAGAYLVVAADLARFNALYPGQANVVGPWVGGLSNSGEDVELEDASGDRVDLVTYADDGDFAIRRRWPLDPNRGWEWYAEHDGLGRSLELVNPNLNNDAGQNWSSSAQPGGTPGVANSVLTSQTAPLISEVTHFPPLPKSTNNVTISARIQDEQTSGVVVKLWWRTANSVSPGPFNETTMGDDSAHNDGAAGDGVYAAILSQMGDGTVVEFYVEAVDSGARSRTWPGPARDVSLNILGQVANASYQVDNGTYTGSQPIYRVIMTETERARFTDGTRNDAQMNATFVSVEGSNVKIRYNCGLRYRGAGSRGQNPPTLRLNLPSDRRWNGVTAMNLNGLYPHAQLMGAVISEKAGLPHEHARAVQLRINGVNPSSPSHFNTYVHVEPFNGEWAENHFPDDGDGNVYRASTGSHSATLEHLGTDPASYLSAGYFKTSNQSENDWTDLFALTFALDLDFTGDADYVAAVRRNANVDLWVRYFAVLSLLEYSETAIGSGRGDDYGMYRGINDPRFMIVPHDFDTILEEGDTTGNPNEDIYVATAVPAINRFLRNPTFQPLYHAELRRLLNGPFSTNQIFPLLDQFLGDWVGSGTISAMKNFVVLRNNGVLNQLPLAATESPLATVTGEPGPLTYVTSATLTVLGNGLTHYKYKLNGGSYSADIPIGTPISLTGLANGTHSVYVLGRNGAGIYQDITTPTVVTWTVNTSLTGPVLNEVLANNVSAVNHTGTFPDLVELYNPHSTNVDLSGLRLSDDRSNPNKFTFPNGTVLANGAYLTLYANNPDGTPGFHLNFSLNDSGETIYLFDSAARGGAILDSLKFGAQLPDRSVGRLPNGRWALTTPTFGSNNIAATTGNLLNLRINEWLADGAFPFEDDFIEIYNPDAHPVDLGGAYLTDNPLGKPAKHQIDQLHFVAGAGYSLFRADGNTSAGPDHLNFGLGVERGEIALLTPQLSVIDCVTYGQQVTLISQGRSPNGGGKISSFSQLTPGAPNPAPLEPVGPQLTSIIAFDKTWRFEDSGVDLGTNWKEPAYVDSGWKSGQTLIGQSRGVPPPEPLRTQVDFLSSKVTYYFRTTFSITNLSSLSAIQLTHIIDDGAVFYVNGQEVLRYNMPGGVIQWGTVASGNILDATYQGPVMLPLAAFQPGDNNMAVEVHQASTGSADIFLGVKLEGVITPTNTPTALVINELLASSQTNSTSRDWVEIYNGATSALDLSDMSFTDDVTLPRKWVFPSGSIISGLGYFRVFFDNELPPSSTNTGFALNASGDAVYLFHKPANGGTLLDSVVFGVQAPDLTIGRIPNGSGAWALNLASPLTANIASQLGNPASLKINEWMADPWSGDDWFEIYNPNTLPVALGGLGLTDDLNDRLKHIIPALSFISVGSQGFQRFEADNAPGNGANHVGFRLSADGESLGIATPDGVMIDELTFEGQTTGVSEGRLPDGQTEIRAFPESASPGDSNFLPIPGVIINEVLSHTDPPFEDAIELRNLNTTNVNIAGWYLSDSKNFLRKYRVPTNTVINANGFKVFYENQFNATPGDPDNFALNSAHGSSLYLSAIDERGQLSGYRSSVKFGAAERSVSFGRFQTSVGTEFVALNTLTFGMDRPDNVQQFRTGAGKTNAYPKIGPIVISGIMYHPPDIGGTEDNVAEEYIQLRNISASPVQLFDPGYLTNRWRFRDAVDFDFPTNTTIPVGATFYVVSFDPLTQPAQLAAFRSAYNLAETALIFGPYQGKLDNSGDSVELYKPDAPQGQSEPDAGFVPYILVERVRYSDLPPWPFEADGEGSALRRRDNFLFANDPQNWEAAAASGPVDSDGDGMPNSWEEQYGLDVNNPADAGTDLDGDGATNLNEFLAGTDPTDPGSRLYLEITGGALVNLRFLALANKSYTLEFRNNLGTGTWSALAHVDPETADRVVSFDDIPSGEGRYYRVRTPRSE